jgi:hypothetical protein
MSPPPASVDDSTPCAIPGCGGPAVRSMARSEVRKAFPKLSEEGRRAPLCKVHYKEWKKATREARTLDRLAW